MKIKPVKNRTIPKYPDKYEIELNKALLYYRPKSWLGKPIIGLSLTALLAAGVNMGCWYFFIPGGVPPLEDYVNFSDTDALRIIKEEMEKKGFTLNMPGIDNGSFQFDAQAIKDTDIRDLEYISMDDCGNKKYPGLEYNYYHVPSEVSKQLKIDYSDAVLFTNPKPYENPEDAIRKQVQDFLEWLAALDL